MQERLFGGHHWLPLPLHCNRHCFVRAAVAACLSGNGILSSSAGHNRVIPLQNIKRRNKAQLERVSKQKHSGAAGISQLYTLKCSFCSFFHLLLWLTVEPSRKARTTTREYWRRKKSGLIMEIILNLRYSFSMRQCWWRQWIALISLLTELCQLSWTANFKLKLSNCTRDLTVSVL